MNGKQLLGKMDLIDPEFIEAADRKPRKRPIMWKQWTALAACLVIAVISGFIMVISPDEGMSVAVSTSDTASLFSAGGIPLITLTGSLLAAAASAAIIIKNKRRK